MCFYQESFRPEVMNKKSMNNSYQLLYKGCISFKVIIIWILHCTWSDRSLSITCLIIHLSEINVTFFSWNLMVAFVSSTFCTRDSWWVTWVGNFPALLNPGPQILGICLIRESDARKASYFLARTKTSYDNIYTKTCLYFMYSHRQILYIKKCLWTYTCFITASIR